MLTRTASRPAGESPAAGKSPATGKSPAAGDDPAGAPGDGFVWRSLPLPPSLPSPAEAIGEPAPEPRSDRPPELRALVCPAFPAPHAFTGRPLPDDPASPGAPDRQAADLDRLRRALGAGTIHSMRQVHGVTVLAAPTPPRGPTGGGPAAEVPTAVSDTEAAEPECDALFTLTPGAALAVKTADCVPLLLHDPLSGAAAAIHAGWRGAAGDVATHAVRAMAKATGSPAHGFHALLGPAIGPCCFEVGPEVLAAFAAAGRDPDEIRSPAPPPSFSPPGDRESLSDRAHLDLHRDTRLRLRAAGLRPDRIHAADACTRCGPDFHSYRREGRRAGRNWAAVRAVRPDRPT